MKNTPTNKYTNTREYSSVWSTYFLSLGGTLQAVLLNEQLSRAHAVCGVSSRSQCFTEGQGVLNFDKIPSPVFDILATKSQRNILHMPRQLCCRHVQKIVVIG